MNFAKKREFEITCFLLIWRMYKRGKPIVDCILIVFVTLNIVMSIMGDITDLEKDILKTDLDKDTLKNSYYRYYWSISTKNEIL